MCQAHWKGSKNAITSVISSIKPEPPALFQQNQAPLAFALGLLLGSASRDWLFQGNTVWGKTPSWGTWALATESGGACWAGDPGEPRVHTHTHSTFQLCSVSIRANQDCVALGGRQQITPKLGQGRTSRAGFPVPMDGRTAERGASRLYTELELRRSGSSLGPSQ